METLTSDQSQEQEEPPRKILKTSLQIQKHTFCLSQEFVNYLLNYRNKKLLKLQNILHSYLSLSPAQLQILPKPPTQILQRFVNAVNTNYSFIRHLIKDYVPLFYHTKTLWQNVSNNLNQFFKGKSIEWVDEEIPQKVNYFLLETCLEWSHINLKKESIELICKQAKKYDTGNALVIDNGIGRLTQQLQRLQYKGTSAFIEQLNYLFYYLIKQQQQFLVQPFIQCFSNKQSFDQTFAEIVVPNQVPKRNNEFLNFKFGLCCEQQKIYNSIVMFYALDILGVGNSLMFVMNHLKKGGKWVNLSYLGYKRLGGCLQLPAEQIRKCMEKKGLKILQWQYRFLKEEHYDMTHHRAKVLYFVVQK